MVVLYVTLFRQTLRTEQRTVFADPSGSVVIVIVREPPFGGPARSVGGRSLGLSALT